MKAFSTALVFLAGIVTAAPTQAQSVTTEFDVTTGYSSEARVLAGSTQLRAFGELKPQLRFNVEGTWAKRSVDVTDAFDAAYPYGGRVQLNEAYIEHSFQRGTLIANVRGGQYRSPFGIYSRADHGYTGFLRAPLNRSAYYWSVNNTMLERGINLAVGTAHLSAEVSIGTPGDNNDSFKRLPGLGTVVRVQGYFKDVIVGASRINTKSYAPNPWEHPGRMDFSSVDVRWSLPGVQLRGEWIFGKESDDGSSTQGGYVDATVHTRVMGPVTAVFRTEKLDWSYLETNDAGVTYLEDWRGFRQTVGARVRIPGGLTAQFNVLRHSKNVAYDKPTAFDFALTYSIRDTRSSKVDQ
jgi:hypothetical protein